MKDHERARKPITRSGIGFRVKVASRKTGRTIECESLLEAAAVHLLDSSVHVRAIYEQPEKVHFHDHQNEPRVAYPDFKVLLQDGRELLIEVKPEDEARRGRVARRIDALAEALARQGRRYRLWTSKDIYSQPRYSVVKSVRSCTKVRLTPEATSKAMAEVVQHQPGNMGELIELLDRRTAFALVAAHHLFLDLNEPLTDGSKLYLSPPLGGANDSL